MSSTGFGLFYFLQDRSETNALTFLDDSLLDFLLSEVGVTVSRTVELPVDVRAIVAPPVGPALLKPPLPPIRRARRYEYVGHVTVAIRPSSLTRRAGWMPPVVIAPPVPMVPEVVVMPPVLLPRRYAVQGRVGLALGLRSRPASRSPFRARLMRQRREEDELLVLGIL